jgi:hypothetical protein
MSTTITRQVAATQATQSTPPSTSLVVSELVSEAGRWATGGESAKARQSRLVRVPPSRLPMPGELLPEGPSYEECQEEASGHARREGKRDAKSLTSSPKDEKHRDYGAQLYRE